MNTATNSKSWEQQSYKLAREISVFLHAGKTEKEKKKKQKRKKTTETVHQIVTAS